MATRGPAGTGWWPAAARRRTARRGCRTRITPDCANSACDRRRRRSGAAAAAAAPGPACRPDFTAITGLVRASPRASRANLRGLPNDSRYSSTTSVAGSVCQNCSRSLPDTSARLPAETNVDRPSPRSAASARMAMPSAPDWQKKPDPARRRHAGASVAFIRTAGSVLTRPRQFGPSTRMPVRPGRATRRALRRRAVRPRRVGEPGGHHHQAVHALGPAGVDQLGDAARPGTATTARSTGVGDVGDRRVGPHAVHGRRRPG